MQAVILCGGLGTRLKEETEFRPKPMVRIGNRPVLWHIMKIYSKYGIKDFIIALGYKGDQIKDYFYNYDLMNSDITVELGRKKNIIYHQKSTDEDWTVTLVNTGDNALKGARIKRIEKYISDDNFFVTYGDGLCDINISDLLNFHKKHGKIATLTGAHPASRYGELNIKENQVLTFKEKPEAGNEYINGGFFTFKKSIFDYLKDEDSCDLEIGALEELAQKGELMIYKNCKNWACMDTLRDVEYLNNLWNENKAFWKVW